MLASFKTLGLPAALLAALVATATGQDPARSPQPAPSPSPSPAPPQAVETSPSLASKLIGTEIVDSDNGPLAKVADFVIEPEGGVVVIAERKEGGLVGIPLELLPPHASVDPAAAERAALSRPSAEAPPIGALQLRADPQLLVSATVIAKNAVKSLDQAALQRVRRHWAKEPATPPDGKGADAPANTPSDAARPLCVEGALGRGVKSPSGDSLAEVKDVAIDVLGAKVAYVVVSSGGVLGLGATAHGVPLASLTRGTDGGFQLNTDRKTLDNSPGINLDRLPSRPSLQVSAKVSLTDGSVAHGAQR